MYSLQYFQFVSKVRARKLEFIILRILGTPMVIMVYGVWCMVYGVWCMVYGVWCMVYGVWCMVYDQNDNPQFHKL